MTQVLGQLSAGKIVHGNVCILGLFRETNVIVPESEVKFYGVVLSVVLSRCCEIFGVILAL